jgi:hypothetical protein
MVENRPVLVRLDRWPERLSMFLQERKAVPYAYGTNDCCSIVQDCILAITGTDVFPGVVRPTTQVGAARFLLERGFRTPEDLADALLEPLPTPNLAQRGDVVSFEIEGEFHLAIVTGSSAETPTTGGLAAVPRAMWRNGWKTRQ